MNPSVPRCVVCGSRNVLPAEKEDDYRQEYSPDVPVYAGVTLVTALLGIIILSFLVLHLGIILLAGWLWWRGMYKKKKKRPRGFFVCLDCSAFFEKK